MGRSVRAVAVTLLGSTLASCAALTGLDQLTEEACAPHCDDAAFDVGQDAAAERARDPGDASEPDASWDAAVAREASGLDAAADVMDASQHEGVDAPQDVAAGDVADASTEADAVADSGPTCTVYFREPFSDNHQGWTLDPTWSVASTCATPPAPQKGFPDPTVDHTTGSAGGVAGAYVCGNNPAGQKSAARYAISPAVDVTGAPALKLAFYRWLNSDSASYMTSTLDVFDGAKWITLYTNPPGAGNLVTDQAWTRIEYDVSAYANASFRVRFGYAATATSVYAMSCWNVDDLTVSTPACP